MRPAYYYWIIINLLDMIITKFALLLNQNLAEANQLFVWLGFGYLGVGLKMLFVVIVIILSWHISKRNIIIGPKIIHILNLVLTVILLNNIVLIDKGL